MQHVIQLLSTGHGQRDAVTLLDSKKFAVLLQDCFSECALQDGTIAAHSDSKLPSMVAGQHVAVQCQYRFSAFSSL